MALYRRKPVDLFSLFLQTSWTLVWSILLVLMMSFGWYYSLVIFRIGNFVFGFYGAGVLGKLFYDLYRARRNARKIDRRRVRALDAMERGEYKPKVGFQQVGRGEPMIVHRSAFENVRDQTYELTRFIYVADGQGVNNDRIRAPSNDPVLNALYNAFKDLPNGPPKEVPPAHYGGFRRFVWTVWNFITGNLTRLFYLLLEAFFQLLILPPRIVYGFQVAVGWVLRLFFPRQQRPQGFIPLPYSEVPSEWGMSRPKKGDLSYIAEIGLRVFGVENVAIFTPDFVLNEVHTRAEMEKENALYNAIRASSAKYIFIFQPARTKREAVYTAAKLHIRLKMDRIFFTDSDSMPQPDAVMESVLASYALKSDKKIIGAVTGDVRIFNVDNWLSLMSSLRYFFAFHVERQSMSDGGYVTCISGPNGLYRAESLSVILTDWMNHEFLGRPTTFGEDRDLTKRILSLNQYVFFTPYSVVWTDTPTSVRIWLRQQIRWNKSYFREFYESLPVMHMHGAYLTMDVWYQIMFPMILATSLLNLMTSFVKTGNWSYLAIWGVSIMMGGSIRGVFGYLLERNAPLDPQGRGPEKYFLFFGYGYLYIGILLWAKLYALLTLASTGWGTQLDRTGKQVGSSTLGAG